jgi:hypothetical protein
MAEVEKLVPGTWLLTVTVPGFGVGRTIITFTSDGGMVERGENNLAVSIGVWEPGDERDEENLFRFMFHRFFVSLTISEPTEEPRGQDEEQEAVNQSSGNLLRVRSTNRLTSNDTFTGAGTADFLDAAGNPPTGPPAFHSTHSAKRLKLVRE